MRPLASRRLRDGSRLCALKCESLGNEIKVGPNAHQCVTDQGDPKPITNSRKRPPRHESGEREYFRGKVHGTCFPPAEPGFIGQPGAPKTAMDKGRQLRDSLKQRFSTPKNFLPDVDPGICRSSS